MAQGWPQSLRPVAKYVARGNEVETQNMVVAFYCNLHAVKEAIRLNKGDGEAFIRSLLEKTEALKKSVGQDDGTHQGVVEQYALARFAEADDEDMSGNVTEHTAKKYFLALCYMDVCKVFKQRSEEIDKKSNFTKSRMIAIQKALRDGTDPRRPELIQALKEEELALEAELNIDEPSNNTSTTQASPTRGVSDTYPAVDTVASGVNKLNVRDASTFPETAPIYESFVDPMKSAGGLGAAHPGRLHIPPARPLPSIPSSSNSAASAHAAPYVPSPQPPGEAPPFFPSPQPVGNAPYFPSPQPYIASPQLDAGVRYIASPQPLAVHETSTPGSATSAAAAFSPSVRQVKSAQQKAKHAVSALDFADYAGAISFLEQAIADLKGS